MKTPAVALTGRVVAVTGAARGIGFQIAKQLVARGAKVVISDVDATALEAAGKELGASLTHTFDVTDPAAFDGFLDRVEGELGPLFALVNNAGIMPTGPLLDESDDTTRAVFEVNVLGMMWGSKKALARMVPRGHGHLVNLASTMGVIAIPGLATYNASKAAMVMYGEALAAEFEASGVRVTTVLPSAVNTDLAAGLDTRAEFTVLGKKMAVESMIEPEDVADAVLMALESGRSHPRLVVPKSLGRVLRSQDLMPLPLKRRFAKLGGINDQILRRTDPKARQDYLDRVTR
ncbi:SDR family oxidoreductase [Nocardioides alcanivorans]|uniref:SDR family oxidoreductase n=1 Tax=Nocardioides alcanivorans TaxID=2897352 RepID=UPI001F3615E1|nr:SDR family oxidoreductase [Nocardioides alcanivorans]